MEIKKIAKGGALPSCLLVTSDQLFVKSPVGGLIMLWRPPISSTTSFPILSHPKQPGIYSRKMTFTLLSRRNVLFSRRSTDWSISNLPDTTKTGQWRIGRGSCGQMRPKSTGLDQMEGPILGRRRENHFLIELPLLQSREQSYGMGVYGVEWGRVLTEVQGIIDAEQYCDSLDVGVLESFE